MIIKVLRHRRIPKTVICGKKRESIYIILFNNIYVLANINYVLSFFVKIKRLRLQIQSLVTLSVTFDSTNITRSQDFTLVINYLSI